MADNEYPKMVYRDGKAATASEGTDVLTHPGQPELHYRIAADADEEKALADDGFRAEFAKPAARAKSKAKADSAEG